MNILAKISPLFLFLPFFWSCKNYPKDPSNTLEKVSGDTLIVGISDNAPWITPAGKETYGFEAELVRSFAQSIGASVIWVEGTESELIPLVKEGEYHMFIGGLTSTSAWKKHVGFTKPYLKVKVFIGASPGITVPGEIENHRIAVQKGNAVAKYIRKKGGIPFFVDSLKHFNGLAAGYKWELEAQGFSVSELVLHQEKHVMAIPNGENAFLMELEKFLEKNIPKNYEQMFKPVYENR